jgi:hypothetical protein
MGALSMSVGLAGLLQCIVRSISLAIWPGDEPDDKNFYISYLFCNIFVVLMQIGCIFAQLYVNKCPYANQNFARFKE